MIKVAILTVSDSAAQGAREDESGPALRERCEWLGWRVVETKILADERQAIAGQLTAWADGGVADLILTTGGTGIGPRDNTPEATRSILERQLPGLSELMRQKGLEQTEFSVLSRGEAGTRGKCLIVNLPGSPKGAVFSLQTMEHLVPHAVDLVAGRTAHK